MTLDLRATPRPVVPCTTTRSGVNNGGRSAGKMSVRAGVVVAVSLAEPLAQVGPSTGD